MTFCSTPLDVETYRLVLISPVTRLVLADVADKAARLPRITIRKWERPAQEIARALEEGWGLKIVVLDLFESQSGNSGCVVGELYDSPQENDGASGRTWCSIGNLTRDELCGSERTAVEDLITKGATGRGAFSRLGWIDDAVAWIGSALPAHQFQFTGDIEQLNATASFCLVRLGNSRGPSYWLKAAGEPNLNEFRVTTELAKLCPQYLPRIVATREAWNAWVMEDAGVRIREPLLLRELEKVTESLAQLQMSTIEHKQTLLASGCFDQRIPILYEHIPELLEYMIEAMEKQTSTKAPRVGEPRLREIGRIALNACTELAGIGVPDTLIHNDFTLGNILIDDVRCIFTDWAEACVGVPLLTYQHLRASISRDEQATQWLPRLDDLYKQVWSSVISESQLNRALMLAPVLAPLSYLYGRGTWLGSTREDDSHLQRCARGLARYMDRSTTADFSGGLCA